MRKNVHQITAAARGRALVSAKQCEDGRRGQLAAMMGMRASAGNQMCQYQELQTRFPFPKTYTSAVVKLSEWRVIRVPIFLKFGALRAAPPTHRVEAGEDGSEAEREVPEAAGEFLPRVLYGVLQPTHPALRAVAASGFRLMTADSENMNDGIRSRSRTSQVARA